MRKGFKTIEPGFQVEEMDHFIFATELARLVRSNSGIDPYCTPYKKYDLT